MFCSSINQIKSLVFCSCSSCFYCKPLDFFLSQVRKQTASWEPQCLNRPWGRHQDSKNRKWRGGDVTRGAGGGEIWKRPAFWFTGAASILNPSSPSAAAPNSRLWSWRLFLWERLATHHILFDRQAGDDVIFSVMTRQWNDLPFSLVKRNKEGNYSKSLSRAQQLGKYHFSNEEILITFLHLCFRVYLCCIQFES